MISKLYSRSAARKSTTYLVTGAAMMVLMVRLADNMALNALAPRITQFGETKTSVILNTIDEWRPVFAHNSPGDRGNWSKD